MANGVRLGLREGGYHLLDLLLVAPVIAGAVWTLFRCRPGYAVYTWLGLLVPLALPWEPRPLMSMPRFVLVLFPAFWGAAFMTERGRLPRTGVVAVSASGLGVLTVLFVNSWFIF